MKSLNGFAGKMHRRFLYRFLIVGLLLAWSISTLALPVYAAPTAQTEIVSGEPSIGDPYTPELGNTGYDVTHYDLQLKIDFDAPLLTGEATIEAISTLANLSRFSLDFASLKAQSVTVDGVEATFTQDEKAQKLFIALPQPLAKDAEFTLKIKYGGEPKTFRSRYLSFLPIGLYVIKEKRKAFAVNEPDAAHSWFPCNDHPRDRATYTFHITVPDDLSAVANGQQQGDPKANGDGTRTFTWKLQSEMSSYLATIAIADYVRKPLPDEGSGVPMHVYAYAADALGAVNALKDTGKFMKQWIETFGPYPFESYGQVLVPQDSVGLEAQTMTILPDVLARSDPDRTLTIVSHELAHMWFGDAISLFTWRDIWLNESFASYAEYLALEAKSGPRAALRTLNGWENVIRVGSGTASIVSPAAGNMFGVNSYLKGGFVLHMLRLDVGDTAFFKILQTYVKRFSGKNATTADFEAVASEVAGKNLTPFFDTWLRRGGLPTVRLTWKQTGDTVEALVCQITKELYAVMIPVGVEKATGVTPDAANPQTLSYALEGGLTLKEKEARLTFKPGFVVGNWVIDPENRILATVNVNKADVLPAACPN